MPTVGGMWMSFKSWDEPGLGSLEPVGLAASSFSHKIALTSGMQYGKGAKEVPWALVFPRDLQPLSKRFTLEAWFLHL